MQLSICIPTHDGRAWCLKDTIDSILRQWRPEFVGRVQICVSDNGSRDDTWRMLTGYERRHPGVFELHRLETNQGGHKNFLKVVDLAAGDYCWLLGSDDTLMPRAIQSALDLLDANYDPAGVTFGWTAFDRGMSMELPSWFEKFMPVSDGEILYREPAKAAEAVGIYLTYMSAHLFRRKAWNAVVAEEGVDRILAHAHHVHLYILGSVVMSGPSWLFSTRKLVNYRSNNWSLVEELNSDLSAYRIETAENVDRCYRHIAGANKRLYRALMYNFFRNWFSPSFVADLKRASNHGDAEDWRVLATMTRLHWYVPAYWSTAVPHLLIPHRAHKLRVQLGLGTRLRRLLGARPIVSEPSLRFGLVRAPGDSQDARTPARTGEHSLDAIEAAMTSKAAGDLERLPTPDRVDEADLQHAAAAENNGERS
jgi:abequosyltransferase